MKNTLFLLLLVIFSCGKDNTTVPFNPPDALEKQSGGVGLRTPDQISIWLENQTGYDKYMNKYHNPDYFLYFTKTNINNEAYEDLEEGLDYVLGKMNGEPLQPEYGFTFVVPVKGGVTGAVYLYPNEKMQEPSKLETIENNIIETVTEWASENGVQMNAPQFTNIGDDKYMVITIDL